MTAALDDPAKPLTYARFVDALDAFADGLPSGVQRTFERDRHGFSLRVEPPTDSHRRLTIMGEKSVVEYQLGRLWGEFVEPDPTVLRYLLASCDAVRDGAVRECRERVTGVRYHVYKLRTRGLREFGRDGEYSVWNWLKLPVRHVSIHRLPPLGQVH